MELDGLNDKKFDALSSIAALLIDTNAQTKTIIDIMVKNKQVSESELEELLVKNRNLSLELLCLIKEE